MHKNFKNYLETRGQMDAVEMLAADALKGDKNSLDILTDIAFQAGERKVLNEFTQKNRIITTVYSSSPERIVAKIKELIGEERIIREYTTSGHYVRFETFTRVFEGASVTENARGRKNHYAYVDANDMGKYESISSAILGTLSPLASDIYEDYEHYKHANHLIFFNLEEEEK